VTDSQFFLYIALGATAIALLSAIVSVIFLRRNQTALERTLVDLDVRARFPEGRRQEALLLEVLRLSSELVNSEREGRPASAVRNPRGPSGTDAVREISHNLNTPMSQIEAATLSLVQSFKAGTAEAEGLINIASLERIQASVRIAKSFLDAYNENPSGKRTVSLTKPDLSASIADAANVFGASAHVNVDLPRKLGNFENSLVSAIVLPILQNAIDENPDSEIWVTARRRGANHQIDVAQRTSLGQLSDNIYVRGYSTKANHQGLGLSGARRLARSAGGDVVHRIDDNQLIFTISMPWDAK
jgi:signal transduction histidine kinase